MNYKNHLIFGISTSIATPAIMNQIGYNLNPSDIALIIPTVIAGSLFPDCDTQSIPSRIYAILGLITSVFFFIAGMNNFIIPLWLPFIFAKMSKHRGWTHSPLLPLGLILVPWLIFKTTISSLNYQHIAELTHEYRFVFLSFSIGLICHLVLDTRWFKKFAISIGIHKE